MTTDVQDDATIREIERLYHELLRSFYDDDDPKLARKHAGPLEALLAERPEVAESIRGEEIRSLIAEVRGDLTEAIRSRESEIRKIFELHSMARDTPAWESVRRRYDFSDVSDRLDLLATLYAEQGDVERAIAVLEESKQFCRSHHAEFDGQDLLDEYRERRSTVADERGRPSPAPPSIDEMIRSAYPEFGVSSDDLLLDARKARLFAEEVNRRLPGKEQVPIDTIKRRLLVLRRRGASRGGLPRLQRSGG